MSLPLEDTIMSEIGLGNHYHWFNGSSSCRGIRIDAARRLSAAIQAAHDRGDPIAPPSKSLCALVQRIATVEAGDSKLTDTWQACSEAIRAHMEKHAGNRSAIAWMRSYLRTRHAGRLRLSRYYVLPDGTLVGGER